jgi:hypothetical protein
MKQMVDSTLIKPVKILKEINFNKASLAIRDDGLAVLRIDTNSEIEVAQVKMVNEALKQMGNGAKFPFLIVVREFTLPSAAARTYIAKADSIPYAKAEAYVIKSLSQRLVGNIYLNYYKPARPTRIFSSELRAVEWLKTFL